MNVVGKSPIALTGSGEYTADRNTDEMSFQLALRSMAEHIQLRTSVSPYNAMKTFLIVTLLVVAVLILFTNCRTVTEPHRYQPRSSTVKTVVTNQRGFPTSHDYGRNNPDSYYNQLRERGLNPNYQPHYRSSLKYRRN